MRDYNSTTNAIAVHSLKEPLFLITKDCYPSKIVAYVIVHDEKANDYNGSYFRTLPLRADGILFDDIDLNNGNGAGGGTICTYIRRGTTLYDRAKQAYIETIEEQYDTFEEYCGIIGLEVIDEKGMPV